MKKLFTSNYARNSQHPQAFGISCSLPKWYEGSSYKQLAPEWNIVGAFKDKFINEEEYAIMYSELLERRGVTAQQVVDDLPDGAIMLCYETPGEFCHRRLVADWIEKETGIAVPEILNEQEKQLAKQANFVDNMIDF